MTSQIASGEENDLKIRAWGDKGGIEWKHSDPNAQTFRSQHAPHNLDAMR